MRRALLSLALLLSVAPAFAAGPPDSQALLEAQRKALDLMAPFDGLWRGPAKILTPDGQWREFIFGGIGAATVIVPKLLDAMFKVT